MVLKKHSLLMGGIPSSFLSQPDRIMVMESSAPNTLFMIDRMYERVKVLIGSGGQTGDWE